MSKIVIFHDSSGVCDSMIRSSRSKMNEKDIKPLLGDVEFINVEKRNLKKYLNTLLNNIRTKDEIIKCFYVWLHLESEINDLSQFLLDNNLVIPMIIYNKSYDYGLNGRLRLFNEIYVSRKEEQGKEIVYRINRYKGEINKETLYTVDLKYMRLGVDYFKTEKDAFEKLKTDITSHIKSIEKSLEREKQLLMDLMLKY